MDIQPLHAGTDDPRAQIDALLATVIEQEASDLHLRCGEPPTLRRHGVIERMDLPALTSDDITAMVRATMSDDIYADFMRTQDADYAYTTSFGERVRCNALSDRTGCGAVFRRIRSKIVTAEELGLAAEVQELASLSRGLVLVTGPAGSGKSTTLCALVDLVNRTRSDHIITIEDPIEFVHPGQKCIVTQREVGTNTGSFKSALRAALREDPDVVLIGEMRDLETASIAIETAETGHLVFATLHTTTAAGAIDRIVDQFPVAEQEQIRVMVAGSLRAVIAQTLCRRIGGGRVAAFEILFNTPSVANLIRERKTFQVQSIMQTSKQHGMVTLNDSLLKLVLAKEIDADEAYLNASDKTGMLAALTEKGFRLNSVKAGAPVMMVSRRDPRRIRQHPIQSTTTPDR
jgi:twitching motility protein PilT